MSLTILHGDVHLIDLQTRLPFKYGITVMSQAPQAFVRLQVEVDGETCWGFAADLLPPKWFSKIPEQPIDDELDEMLGVVEHAVETARGQTADSAYELWQLLYYTQAGWGRAQKLPPLLSNFGATLIERAMIEAVCRAKGTSFAQAVRDNRLGIRLPAGQPADLLPARPLERVVCRHTIGMADPLTEAEIADHDRLDDGLPQSLEACIARYRLRHFKVKVGGDAEQDVDRLERIAAVLGAQGAEDFAFSLDGNEQFRSLDEFRGYWESISNRSKLQPFFEHLLFVEQPFHRDIALDFDVLDELKSWVARPPLIIDESDAELHSLDEALALGYQGTSHKNCKGVFKSIANACKLELLRRDDPAGRYLMSGEDLANTGPVALLQDLAVMATLGVFSVERNGHHYFAGLSAFPAAIRQQVCAAHGDLFDWTSDGWPTLTIRDGQIELGSVIAAPLGVGFELDINWFTPVDEWRRAHGLV
jgi:hypothetical protein